MACGAYDGEVYSRALRLDLVLAFASISSALAAAQSPAAPTLHIPRLADGVARPKIDGLLDDPAWQGAALIDELRQAEPIAGAPASEATEVRLMYDSRAIFVSLLCFDRDLAGIRDTQMRRD